MNHLRSWIVFRVSQSNPVRHRVTYFLQEIERKWVSSAKASFRNSCDHHGDALFRKGVQSILQGTCTYVRYILKVKSVAHGKIYAKKVRNEFQCLVLLEQTE